MKLKIHIVRSSETLSDIAQKYNITLERLQELNPHLSTSEILNFGEKVRVPTGRIPLSVSKNDDESIDPAPAEEFTSMEYQEYPKNNQKSSATAESLPGELPKPPAIDELSNWSEWMDSSSMLDNSSVYENPDTSYMETPPGPYPYFRQGTYMPPLPQPVDPAYYPMLQGWPAQPCYVPPMPMSYPYINSFNPPPAVSRPEREFAVRHQEWKESSSSEG